MSDGAKALRFGRGDAGLTDLLGGERVPKHDRRVEAYGELDEASSALGLARALSPSAPVAASLLGLQRDFFVIMSELAATESYRGKLARRIGSAEVARLDQELAAAQERAPLPRAFILPGACPQSAAIDLARAIVRRAERRVSELAGSGAVANEAIMRYLNRASTLLFALARAEEAAQGLEPTLARDVPAGVS